MKQRFETAATVILVFCALAVTALAFKHEFTKGQKLAQTRADDKPVLVSGWQSFEKVGRRVGPANARVVITEFVDLECPYCKTFNEELAKLTREMEEKYPSNVAVVFVHFPLPMHRFAKIAGQAVECAAAQGRFTEMQESLFAKQDSLGLKPWFEYASAAGVQDSAQYANCLRDSTSGQRVMAGLVLAQRLKLPATPTIFVNGWQFRGTPSVEQITDVIDRIMGG